MNFSFCPFLWFGLLGRLLIKVGLRWLFINGLTWVQNWVKSGFLGAQVGEKVGEKGVKTFPQSSRTSLSLVWFAGATPE